MNRNLLDQVGTQGRITGTVYLDEDEVAWRRNNNRTLGPEKLFKGAATDKAFTMQPNEIALARRNMESTLEEHAFTSLSGLPVENLGRELRQTYFVGVIIGSDEHDEGGVAVVKSGTVTVVNNGPADIHAGDLVCYTFPNPKDVNYHAQGSSPQKVTPVLRTFKPYDVDASLELMKMSLESDDTVFGVKTMSYMGYDEAREKLSPIQEEAMGVKYGELLKMARAIELNEIRKGQDALSARKAALEFFTHYKDRMYAFVNELTADADEVDTDVAENAFYEKYVADGLRIALRAQLGAYEARRANVIGRAMGTAPAYGGSLDLMLRLH